MRYQRFRASARLVVTLLLALSALAGMFHGRRTARAFHEDTQLTAFERADIATPTEARTDGVTVVWNESHAEGSDDTYQSWNAIAAARVTDRQRFEIARGPATDGDTRYTPPSTLYYPPDVDGDLVAWATQEALAGGDGQTFVFQVVGAWLAPDGSVSAPFTLASSAPSTLDAGAVFSNVRVTGDWVVWTQVDSQNVSIVARNVVTLADPVVLSTRPYAAGLTPVLSQPEVDAGWVVWGDEAAEDVPIGQRQFVAYRLGEPGAATTFTAPGVGPFDFKAGVFVTLMDFSGDFQNPGAQEVLVHTLAGAERRLRFTFPMPYAGSGFVSTDGRYVYMGYSLYLSGSDCCGYRTLAYDLQTNSTFAVLDNSNSVVNAEGGALTWVAGVYQSFGKVINATTRADRLPSAPVLDTRDPSADYTYFPATQHYLSYGFKAAWEQWGGLPVFGYPLTEEYQSIGADGAARAAQYLERQRFEWHPENAGTSYEVELGRLGAELLAAQGRDWLTFPRADPSTPNYEAVTGHAIAPEFVAYWSSHGLEFGDPGVSYRESLALFGYPISEPLLETNADGDTVMTQYFERAVFEYHPENAGTPYDVLLRRLGAEALAARGW